ncbi:hypothetical protein O3P69_010803 [Scylla paramamosain]|uniref:Uncharacterized protein n=1 Tax=Scylla paramamosain TaxID=85552 RepID=A0AAW0TGA2_SCYPA
MTRGKRVRNEGSSRDEFILITRERCPRYPQEARVSTTQENGSSLRLSHFASLRNHTKRRNGEPENIYTYTWLSAASPLGRLSPIASLFSCRHASSCPLLFLRLALVTVSADHFLRCRHSWIRLHPTLVRSSMQGFGYKAQQAASACSYNDHHDYCCDNHNYKRIPQQPLTTRTKTTTTTTTTPIDSLTTPRESLNTESLL